MTGEGPRRYLDRELSWLDFNARVLALAEDRSLPLLERVAQACYADVFPKPPDLRIVPAALGDRGGSMGAALMAAERLGATTVKR